MAKKQKPIDCVCLDLPFPPSVNTYWRRSGKHMHLSKRARQYKKEVAAILLDKFGAGIVFPDQRLKATILLYPPSVAKRDIDNYPKAIFDALNDRLWGDDGQVDSMVVIRKEKATGGKVAMMVAVIDE